MSLSLNKLNKKFISGCLFCLFIVTSAAGNASETEPLMALRHDLLSIQACSENLGKAHSMILSLMSALENDYEILGKYNEALYIANEALDLCLNKNGKIHTDTISAMSDLSKLFRQTQQYAKAKEIDEAVCSISKELYEANSLSLQKRADYINNLAEDCVFLNEDYQARSLYEELIALYDKEDIDMPLTKQINAYFAIGENQKTVELCEIMLERLDNQAISFLTKIEEMYIKRILAKAYIKMELYDDALATYMNIIESYEFWRDQDDSLSDNVKKAQFSSIVDVYKECAFLAYKLNYPDMSFQITELCRMRNLVDQFSEESLYQSGLFLDEETQKIAAYEAQLAAYEERIKAAMAEGNIIKFVNIQLEQIDVWNEYRAYKQKLQSRYSQYRRILVSRRHDALKFSKYRRVLPDGARLIEFSLYPEKNLILVYVMHEDNNLTIQSIDIQEDFLTQCQVYHDLLAYPHIDAMRADNKYLWKFSSGKIIISQNRKPPAEGAKIVNSTKEFRTFRQKLSEYLGETLLSPINNSISSSKIWIIVPDGELSNIPFETLHLNGQAAIINFDISYVPSLAVLKLMQDRGIENSQKANRKELFAMGDALYGVKSSQRSNMRETIEDLQNALLNRGSGVRSFNLKKLVWDSLPGTKKEIERVASLFPESKITVYQGRDAAESRLKSLNKNGELIKYKYFLFAAHGLFIPKLPELSSIVLSQGIETNEDGYVTIEKWMTYNLASNLVYLSACESGLGGYYAGEGIIGIPYALCMAGNQDTVMSLWKVADTQTAKFSSAFFEKLYKGILPIEALNKTKREFMINKNTKYSDPSVWSAFLLYGI